MGSTRMAPTRRMAPPAAEFLSRSLAPPRIVVAGVGNVLRGDDGFGPAVIRALDAAGPLPPGVRTVEVGIGGIGLVHELLDGCDALVVVDAVNRGGEPGSLYILEPEVPDASAISPAERQALATDLHEVVPGQVLILARALNVLPPVVRIIGCQPAETEEFSLELTPVVQRAVPTAIAVILGFAANLPRSAQSGPVQP
jgi:hydrogenase maturation protease